MLPASSAIEGLRPLSRLSASGRRSRRNRDLAILCLVAGIVTASWVVAVDRYALGTAGLLELLLFACIVTPLVVRTITGSFDLFEPIVSIAATYTVYFVVGPLVRLLNNDTFFVGREFRPLYTPALIAVIVAVIAMWLGYHSPFGDQLGRKLPPRARRVPLNENSSRRLRRYGWTLTVASALALILWSRLTGISLAMFFLPALLSDAGTTYSDGGLAYLFLTVEWLVPAFLLLSISGALRSRFSRWLYFIVVTVVYMSLGSRYRIVTLWMAAAILAYLRKGKRPGAPVIAFGVCIVLVFSAWLSSSRVFFRSGGDIGEVSTSIQEVQDRSLNDTKVFEAFAALLNAVPERIDFAYADPIAYVFIQPIPRFIWPSKPYPTFLQKIAAAVDTRGAEVAGLAVPHFGEYYLAFGWLGLMAGMFLFGVVCKALWAWYRAAPHDPWRQAVFALSNAFIFNMIIRGYTAQIVQAWFFIVFPAVFGMYLVKRGRRRVRFLPA